MEIRRERIREEPRKSRDDLETRVAERTEDLGKANERLQHAIEHALILCRDDSVITLEHLPLHSREFAESDLRLGADVIGEVQIRQALDRSAGNKAKAARLLGIDRKTLYRKMRRYHMADIKP